MKYHLALLFGGIFCLGAFVPAAEAKPKSKRPVVVVRVGHGPYWHHGHHFHHRRWVPGHFVWHRDHRHWVPGHYVYW